MANAVFANGREISCKAAAGKTICATPDVCFTPPENPATPPGVPVPYPNTGLASDTTSGSKKVKISNKEVGLKDKSYFKKSSGDEAGSAAKKGVVTSQNRGKVYFQAWSMDVKIEGQNATRHLDMTTNNHASMPGDTPPWMYSDSQYLKDIPEDCHKNFETAREACQDSGNPKPPDNCDDACRKAQACVLIKKAHDKKSCCAPGNTGHHLVPAHCFTGVSGYENSQAPCVCAGGWSWHRNDKSGISNQDKTHPALHEHQDVMERRVIAAFPVLQKLGRLAGLTREKPWRYGAARNIGIAAHKKVFPKAECNDDCLKAQLDSYHNSLGIKDNTPVKAKRYGNKDRGSSGNTVQHWKDRAKKLGLS